MPKPVAKPPAPSAEGRIVDETVDPETPEPPETPTTPLADPTETPETPETPEAPEPPEPADAEPSADQLAEAQAKIDALTAELAAAKGQPPPPAPVPSGRRVSSVDQFVARVPAFKQAFTEGQDPAAQFDTLSQFTDQLVGAVLEEQVYGVQETLSRRLISLENELEMRDLRADPESGTVFRSLEAPLRAILAQTPWKDRGTSGTIRALYHRLLGERLGHKPAAPAAPAVANGAHDQARDVSAGTRAQPRAPVAPVKLSAAQEADFQAMVEEGVPVTRERYLARYKARADKARADQRPVPATLRSFR